MVWSQLRTNSLPSYTEGLLEISKKLAQTPDFKVVSVINVDEIESVELNKIYSKGADKVLVYEGCKYFEPNAIAKDLVESVQEINPDILLFPHTENGSSLAARVAQKFKLGMISDCARISIDDNGNLNLGKHVYDNRAFAELRHQRNPQIVTVSMDILEPEGKVFEPKQTKKIIKESSFEKKTEYFSEEIKKLGPFELDLEDAEIIVAAGRGVSEEIELIGDFAKEIGGSVACSRPVIDNGLLPKDRLVGQSGKQVSPKLYVACGISGSPQHTVGMKNSENIISINTDPSARIFNYADLGIVGDVHEVLPRLARELEERRIKG